MSAEDRVAIILGRAIIRAEALQAENEALRARLAEHENGITEKEPATDGV